MDTGEGRSALIVYAGYGMNILLLKNITRFYLIISVVAAMLLSSCKSVDVNAKDDSGNSPLHSAVIRQDVPLVRKLIKKGAKIDACNNYGATPVRFAAYIGNNDLVTLLVSGGSELNYSSAAGKPAPGKSLFNIVKYPCDKPNFFLTFDMGSDNLNLDYILTTLKKYRIKATFFTTGEFMEKYPDDLKRILNDGHVVGNHTYSHSPDYQTPAQLVAELRKTENLFKKITGKEIARIWRSPNLQHLYKPWMLGAAAKIGYRHIDVTLATADWVGRKNSRYLSNDSFLDIFRSRLNMKRVGRTVMDRFNFRDYKSRVTDYSGTIMLMHAGKFRDGRNDFVYTLEDVIIHLISMGYLFDNCGRFAFNEQV